MHWSYETHFPDAHGCVRAPSVAHDRGCRLVRLRASFSWVTLLMVRLGQLCVLELSSLNVMALVEKYTEQSGEFQISSVERNPRFKYLTSKTPPLMSLICTLNEKVPAVIVRGIVRGSSHGSSCRAFLYAVAFPTSHVILIPNSRNGAPPLSFAPLPKRKFQLCGADLVP
ncbi:hypothetical protein MPH_09790 [Macrophomina phaseolina MS6]|uniref:Uncharacterized protein n=1 Tax=Macrophomina phaseolina (strain MS6) TaxID=1126212 RepID=K2S873_MACPH|nr:hypothetical protein MPH_09790 [Macrophomina phaseolina MS6]